MGCARPGIAGIYSRVATNLHWIESYMEKSVRGSSSLLLDPSAEKRQKREYII